MRNLRRDNLLRRRSTSVPFVEIRPSLARQSPTCPPFRQRECPTDGYPAPARGSTHHVHDDLGNVLRPTRHKNISLHGQSLQPVTSHGAEDMPERNGKLACSSSSLLQLCGHATELLLDKT